jgi:DNA-binding PadR family transcriptional regulator
MNRNVRLMVLGALRRQSMHGYEIQRLSEQSQTAQWAGVLPGSVYHALKVMTEEGLVQIRATEARGNKQRAVYEITAPGEASYLALLREAWERRPDSLPSSFYIALTFWEDLPRDELRERLELVLTGLRQQRNLWNQGEEAKSKAIALPEWLSALFQNGRDHYEADIRLLERLRILSSRENAP